MPDIWGIGIESYGGMSSNGKKLLHTLAERIEKKKNISKSILINRMRSQIIAILNKWNAKMIYSSFLNQW